MGLYPNHIKTAIFASNSAYFAQILSYIQNFCSTFCNVTYFNPQLILNCSLSSRQMKKQKMFLQDLRNEVLVFF